MRGTRWLLLLILVAIVCGIGARYRALKIALREQDRALVKPAPLPLDLNSTSEAWHLTETDSQGGTGRTKAEISAVEFKEQANSARVDLKGVTLHIHNKKGDTYNLVKSAEASYFKDDRHLYSEGDVEITLNLPLAPAEGDKPQRTPVSIKSSGVTYDTNGRAETDRASTFTFEHGDGTATGATYDPATHQLFMKSDVKVDWKPIGPNAKLMKIEGGSLEYHEAESEILLKPWGRLTRENTVVEGENVLIHLQDDGEGHKEIRKIEATKAHGTDTYPNRSLVYSADQLWVDFDDDGKASKITAQTNAHLVSTSETTATDVAASHVELNFAPVGSESVLTDVTASGNSVVTSKPVLSPGHEPGETHVLRSETIEMKMREGGHDISSLVTHAPGSLEFLPNLPAQHHRTLDGKDMVIAYGAQNRIESFRATSVKTMTDPSADELKRDPNRKPSVTASRDMLAHFDPKTSHMASMEQWGDFTYEQGDRRARAAKASLDNDKNLILLETSARMSDSTGSTSADHIRMDERTGDFIAEGGVNSSRLPEKDQNKNSQMLSGDEPMQALARKMESSNHNRTIHYEGDVSMWQGANRIQASVIDLDREKRGLVADGNVVTNLWEQPKDEDSKDDPKPAGQNQKASQQNPKAVQPNSKSGQQNQKTGEQKTGEQKKSTAPVLTVVHAPHLVYTEANRLAVYSGGVTLNRPGLNVKAKALQAFLAESGADSRLERAFADGAVEIVQNSRLAARTGSAEHAEYYTGEQKVYLKGGAPKLVERKLSGKQDTTEGNELTYFANDDRLLVNGSPAKRGQTLIQRK